MAKNKRINPKTKLFWWRVINIIVLVLPLCVLLIIKRDEYFTPKTTINNMTGLILIAVFIILSLRKRSDFLKGCWGGLILFGAVFFLRNILYDLVLITGCYEIGMFLSTILTIKQVRKWERICDKVETAKINATANAEAFGVNKG